ncbi:hypothetical protein [Pelagibius sp. Alg239-R121]|uniref:hypothetical protein n=1 Tax=Pelagibius sp. Alg239-R121 TaxID=2993448 RepID=UPI0024A79ED7|nr:hypothetical protein [Pelagibius sp. Alg239-R121]
MQMTLNADKIIATVDTLAQRVSERFPEAGLSKVAKDFTKIARKMRDDALALEQPNWRLRLTTFGILAAGVILFGFVFKELHFSSPLPEAATLVQIIEPAANIAILVALGIAFIVSLEGRWKRKQALVSLHSLRSMIHVIDMHQLTKDPSVLLDAIEPTASSPKRTMGRVEIQRYLDYCSEMLSLSGKIAALYTQSMQDQVVIETVNELEALSTNLTRKIWQKIMILDRAASDGRGNTPSE